MSLQWEARLGKLHKQGGIPDIEPFLKQLLQRNIKSNLLWLSLLEPDPHQELGKAAVLRDATPLPFYN